MCENIQFFRHNYYNMKQVISIFVADKLTCFWTRFHVSLHSSASFFWFIFLSHCSFVRVSCECIIVNVKRRRKKKVIFHARRRGYESTDVYILFIPVDVDLASSSFNSCSFEVIPPSDPAMCYNSIYILYILL